MGNSDSAIIFNILDKLRQFSQVDIQSSWKSIDSDLAIFLDKEDSYLSAEINLPLWQNTIRNEKGYLVWEAGQKVKWFATKFTIPKTIKGYSIAGLTLFVSLTWWAENAQVFVNNKLIQVGDLFDSSARILLKENAISGEEITIAIRLVSPGHDIGGLMKSRFIYETPKLQQQQQFEPGFIADELTVLAKYLTAFEPDKLDLLVTEIITLENNFFPDSFLIQEQANLTQYLLNLRQQLQPLAKNIKQRCFKILGHAHLDMAWLWESKETWEVAQRTFISVLNLQKEFPNLTFCHTSPALYEWIENNRPDIFTAIQAAVKTESWEILGGMWIEPEVNLISGESLIRQILYGQQYFQDKFNKVSNICWLTDSFGFPWQLPQILKQSGIDYFVTQKLHWNDSTSFPHGVFKWQSPDGSEVLGLMSPPNVTGVMDTNPITMTNYAVDWEQQTGKQAIFWLPGVGDHGGGPTRDMLEVQKRWQNSPFFPKSEFTTARDYLSLLTPSQQEAITEAKADKINTSVTQKDSLPIWNNELYLELHRGCYTTHADQKYYNRRCEEWLYQAELFASLAKIITGCDYPKTQLEIAWKQVLFNQFHDILPGTCIPPVFVEANENWEKAGTTAKKIIAESLNAIALNITLPPPPHPEAKPIFIFNPLNWKRSEIISLNTSLSKVYDSNNNLLPTQTTRDNNLLFLAEDIPSIGYRLFWLSPTNTLTETLTEKPTFPNHYTLENNYLRVSVNPHTGDLDSIFDKTNQIEILRGAGNQLQGFEDKGQYWDAWNIDPNYAQHPLPPTQLKSIQWRDYGDLRQTIRVVRQLNNSTFTQDYILDNHSPLLKITTTVNWREDHVLVKTAFPLNLEADFASYEIACGTINRTTKPQTDAEKAQWEVYAHRWADLTNNDQKYGVSLLNDCKYGYDSKPNQIRLTLLRSPKWTDPDADRGIHHFTYSIYPHQGTWQDGKTVHHGYELNLPLQVTIPSRESKSSSLLPSGSFLHLQGKNLILTAFKETEANTETFILRYYEAYGKATTFSLSSDLNLTCGEALNIREETVSQKKQTQVQPWQIQQYKIYGDK